jgi:hypothetical protein
MKKFFSIIVLFAPLYAFANTNLNLHFDLPPEANGILNKFLEDPVGNAYNIMNSFDQGQVPDDVKVFVQDGIAKIQKDDLKDLPRNINLPKRVDVNVQSNDKGVVNVNVSGVPDGIQKILNQQLTKTRTPVNFSTTTVRNFVPNVPPYNKKATSTPPRNTAPSNASNSDGKMGQLKSLLKCSRIEDSNGNTVSQFSSYTYFFVSAQNPKNGKNFIFAYQKGYIQKALNDELGFVAPNVNKLPDSVIQQNLEGQCYSSNSIQKTSGTVCCLNSSCTTKFSGDVYTSIGQIPAKNFGDCRDVIK